MTEQNTVSLMSSLHALTEAAKERHAALAQELAQLETAFPTLANGAPIKAATATPRTRRRFSAEEKAQAVAFYRTSGLNVHKASSRLGLNGSVLRAWVLEADAKRQQPQPELVSA